MTLVKNPLTGIFHQEKSRQKTHQSKGICRNTWIYISLIANRCTEFERSNSYISSNKSKCEVSVKDNPSCKFAALKSDISSNRSISLQCVFSVCDICTDLSTITTRQKVCKTTAVPILSLVHCRTSFSCFPCLVSNSKFKVSASKTRYYKHQLQILAKTF